MTRRALAALLLAAAPLQAGSVVVARHAAMATASPAATQIGLSVMRHGGNAIDAAVAAAFALAVLKPESGNLGGGGFLLYYDAAHRAVWALDFREVAPEGTTADLFSGVKAPREGAITAGIPGTVAGLDAMHRRFGTAPWKALIAPAILLARADSHVPKDLEKTLARLAAKGGADFYRGDIAATIVDGVRKGGGIISHTDLRDYKPVWRAPIRVDAGRFDIYAAPPPSAAGLMIAEELNILSGFDLKAAGYQTAAEIHLIAEAERRAAIDRDRYLGDPAAQETPYAELLSAQHATRWRATINPARATPTMSLTHPEAAVAEGAHTTHISVVDPQGDVAELTTSLGDDFGSGYIVPHCGFYLNDAMRDFTPGNSSSPNAIASGRRMATSASPTIILRDGKPYLGIGTSGGAAIPNIVVQIFLDVSVFGKSLPDAVDAPRFDQQAVPEDMTFESTHVPAAVVNRLRAMGHGMHVAETVGDVQAVMMDGSGITAVSDSRHNGAAGGF